MSDIAILKDLLDPSMIVCLQEKQEGTHIRYSVILEETQDNYSVSIGGMPNPHEVIIINVDKFKVIPHVFKGNKGEGKRADFVIVANTKNEKIILCIELKKRKKSQEWIVKQLKGAKCFIVYCQALAKNFWEKHDFLDGYEYRFVTIGHINTNKTTTRINNRKRDNSSTSEIHDSPEKMRKNQKSSAPRGGVWKSFARKPLVSIASLYFSPQGAGNYTHTRLNIQILCNFID